MKINSKDIVRFEISPMAKAGVYSVNMGMNSGVEHDVSQPHRDDHFMLMFATKGDFRFNIDFEDIQFSAPAMLFITPEQVHRIIEVKEPEGWIIGFDQAIVNENLKQLLENRFNNPMQVEAESDLYQRIFILMDLIEKLQSGISDGHTNHAIHALLDAMIHLLAGKVEADTVSGKSHENRSFVIKEAFSQLLKKNYKVWKQPAQYASELAVSAAHLNDTVKALTGIPVSVHIQQVSILEAKRLLYFTNNSVKEISYEVGYEEPVYFGKLFKKVTGCTPLEFRQQFRV